ncbi:Uncharacterized protein PBTT_07962 [Plasmodiophora brassicae]
MQPPPPLAMAALLASALVAARVASGVKVYPTYCLLLDMVDARCREVPLRPLEASGGDPIADNATPPSDPYGLYCALTIPFDARLLYNCLPNRITELALSTSRQTISGSAVSRYLPHLRVLWIQNTFMPDPVPDAVNLVRIVAYIPDPVPNDKAPDQLLVIANRNLRYIDVIASDNTANPSQFVEFLDLSIDATVHLHGRGFDDVEDLPRGLATWCIEKQRLLGANDAGCFLVNGDPKIPNGTLLSRTLARDQQHFLQKSRRARSLQGGIPAAVNALRRVNWNVVSLGLVIASTIPWLSKRWPKKVKPGPKRNELWESGIPLVLGVALFASLRWSRNTTSAPGIHRPDSTALQIHRHPHSVVASPFGWAVILLLTLLFLAIISITVHRRRSTQTRFWDEHPDLAERIDAYARASRAHGQARPASS